MRYMIPPIINIPNQKGPRYVLIKCSLTLSVTLTAPPDLITCTGYCSIDYIVAVLVWKVCKHPFLLGSILVVEECKSSAAGALTSSFSVWQAGCFVGVQTSSPLRGEPDSLALPLKVRTEAIADHPLHFLGTPGLGNQGSTWASEHLGTLSFPISWAFCQVFYPILALHSPLQSWDLKTQFWLK